MKINEFLIEAKHDDWDEEDPDDDLDFQRRPNVFPSKYFFN